MVLRVGLGFVVAIALAGCQQAGVGESTGPEVSATPPAPPAQDAPARSEPEANDALKVVRHFDQLCYGTKANSRQIARMADAMGLEKAPAELMEMLSGGRGDAGDGYLLDVDQEAGRLMAVGVGDNGTCSIYAGGYDADAIEAGLKENFKLLQLGENQVGMQTMTMHVPGGTSNLISETHKKGVVSIVRSKPASGGNEILIGFIPPELAKATFQ